jgi:ArsR family transcriptional regulator, lead/cadmium/zinc/bismuth-responsive transcriptional repressor
LQSIEKSIEGERKRVVRRSILDQIFKEMMNVRQRLDNIENNFASWNPQPVQVPESSLITLPDHLRKTYVVVATKGECDAVQVSNYTGRCRAIESNYLNQLLRMGWLNKRRISKAVHFRPVAKKQNGQTISLNMK